MYVTPARRKSRSGAPFAVCGSLLVTFAISGLMAAPANSEPVDTPEEIAALVADVSPVTSEVDLPVVKGTNLISADDDGAVEIPRDGDGAVSLIDESGSKVAIDLPPVGDLEDAEITRDGTVVYRDADGGVDLAVQAVDGGVRIQTILNHPDVPHAFAYPLELSEDATLELIEGGAVLAINSDGTLEAGLAPPWAVDATGESVETWYEVRARTVTQIVAPDPDAAYPIVADPYLGKSIWSRIGITYPNGYPYGGTKLSGYLTAWGQLMRSSAAAPYIFSKPGLAEFADKSPRSLNMSQLNQYFCHVKYHMYPQRTWDLESWRAENGNWWSTKCNWK